LLKYKTRHNKSAALDCASIVSLITENSRNKFSSKIKHDIIEALHCTVHDKRAQVLLAWPLPRVDSFMALQTAFIPETFAAFLTATSAKKT
jgi:hypothetical protein